MSALTWTLLAAAVVLLLAVTFLYNRLVRARNRVEEGWAQIDVQLRRRHDLDRRANRRVATHPPLEDRIARLRTLYPDGTYEPATRA